MAVKAKPLRGRLRRALTATPALLAHSPSPRKQRRRRGQWGGNFFLWEAGRDSRTGGGFFLGEEGEKFFLFFRDFLLTFFLLCDIIFL